MHAAVRPYVTTGVALVGSSVIAIAPLAPSPPDIRIAEIRVTTAAVQLTAAPNPIEFYPQVLKEAFDNAGLLLQQYVTVGTQLAKAFVAQPGQLLKWALVAVVNPGTYVVGLAIASTPVANTIGATIAAGTDVFNAVAAFHPFELINAIVDIPARIIDGALNGGYPYKGSGPAGLLSPFSPGDRGTGPLAFPILVAQLILDLSSPPAITSSAPVDTPPNLEATTLTLTTGLSLDSGSTPTDQGLTQAASDALLPTPTIGASTTAAPTDPSATASEVQTTPLITKLARLVTTTHNTVKARTNAAAPIPRTVAPKPLSVAAKNGPVAGKPHISHNEPTTHSGALRTAVKSMTSNLNNAVKHATGTISKKVQN
jgi:hypothetical protein